MSFLDRMIWSVALLAAGVAIVFRFLSQRQTGGGILLFFAGLLFLIAAIIAVKAMKRRSEPQTGVCDVCGGSRRLLKSYSLKSGVKTGERLTKDAAGHDMKVATFADLRSHSYRSCSLCEWKKYGLRLAGLAVAVAILLLAELAFPGERLSKNAGEILGFPLLLLIVVVFFGARHFCPIGRLEKKAIEERRSESGPEDGRKWEAFG